MIKVIIAAAGKGTRSKLNYPKTLFKIEGVPILIRLLKATWHIDSEPIIIVSEEGRKPIGEVIEEFGFSSRILVQKNQLGMGDAVLQCRKYRNIKKIENSLLLWGDLPFIKKRTLNKLIDLHLKDNSDFSFPTIVSPDPYTLVKRDIDQGVVDLIELKNSPRMIPIEGERDIGVFIFNIFSSIYELEISQLSERTSDTLQSKKRNGKVYSGSIMYGFDRNGDRLVENPYEQKVLRKIYSLRDKGLSYQKISDFLNRNNHPTKHNKRWNRNGVYFLLQTDRDIVTPSVSNRI